MPILVTGPSTLTVGSVSTYTTTATPGGAWASSNTAAVTIDAVTGVATGVGVGITQISYTVAGDSGNLQVAGQAVGSLTNGMNFNTVYSALQNRVLWQSQGIVSDSNRFFEDFHPLNDTALLDAMRPKDGSTLTQYLGNLQRSVIMDMLNAVYNAPQMLDKAKLVFFRENQPLPYQLVTAYNPEQFVGLQIYPGKGDKTIKLNSLQLFFTEAVDFNLYLYNDFFLDPVMTIPVHAEKWNLTIIDLGQKIILTNLVPEAYKGGRWYLGYWQGDLGSSQAIYYPVNYSLFHNVDVIAFSAPQWTDPNGNKNFQRNNIGANNLMYGMNLELSTFVDGTNNIVQANHLYDELIGLMMTVRNIKNYIFNYRSNDVRNKITSIPELGKLYAELNGFKADDEIPYVLGLKDMVNREIKRVKQSFQKKDTIKIGW